MPVGNVLVGNSRSDVEHDDTALTVNVVSISQPAKLLLTSGIPNIELEFTKVGKKAKRAERQKVEKLAENTNKIYRKKTSKQARKGALLNKERGDILNLDTKSSDIFFFELAGQVTLDEGSLHEKYISKPILSSKSLNIFIVIQNTSAPSYCHMAEVGGREISKILGKKVKDQKRGKRKYLSGATITDKNKLKSRN